MPHPAAGSVAPVTATSALDLTADLHTHTTFSSGRCTVAGVVARAALGGLCEVGVSDRAPAVDGWLEWYTSSVRQIRAVSAMSVRCGLETEPLGLRGQLDLPADLDGVDYVLLAGDRLPGPDGPRPAEEVRRALATGRTDPRQVLDQVLLVTERAVNRMRVPTVVSFPFRVLRAVGLDHLATDAAGEVARICLATGAGVEVGERHGCPSVPVALLLAGAGVPLVAGSGATTAEEVGRWSHLSAVAAALSAVPLPDPRSPFD